MDVFPGDRAEACRGMMEPVSVAVRRGGYEITHRCVRCSARRRNKANEHDSSEALCRAVNS